MFPRLIAVAGPLTGASLPLTRAETFFGGDDDNHVSLADRTVSGRHCVVAVRDGLATLRDFDEGNGSFVNGLPAGARPLADGDEIQIGRSLFIFQAGAAAADPVGSGGLGLLVVDSGFVNITDDERPASSVVVIIARTSLATRLFIAWRRPSGCRAI